MSTSARSSRAVRSGRRETWSPGEVDCDVNRPLPPLPLHVDTSSRRPSQEPSSSSSPRRPRMKSRPSTADSTLSTSSTSSTSSTTSRYGILSLPPLTPSTSVSAPSSPSMPSSSSPKSRRQRFSSFFPSSSSSASTDTLPPRPRPQISQPMAAATLSSELEERYGPMNFCALAQVLRSPGFGKAGERESWGLLPKEHERRQ